MNIEKTLILENIWYYLCIYPFWVIWYSNIPLSKRTYKILNLKQKKNLEEFIKEVEKL